MRKVGFIIYPGYQPMGLAVTAPFEIANRQAAEPVYDIRMLSKHGGPVRTSLGFHVSTEPFSEEPYDLIVVAASMEDASPETIEFIRHARSHCRRIAATCHGAFLLAEAGLLDGRRATTHWVRAGELRARYPNVRVEEDRIFSAASLWPGEKRSPYPALPRRTQIVGHSRGDAWSKKRNFSRIAASRWIGCGGWWWACWY
jgi:transcriptional regulator GlxA family with amidase domain